MRIGHGYDVHRLVPGRRLILGGVEIPHEAGLEGHSDADVLAHAATDAMLGAMAMGDIGQHFPDNDPQFLNADSMGMLGHIARMIGDGGWRVGNLDAVIVAERPKVSGHIAKMRENLAGALGVEVGAVSVKATTEEGLGFTGARMGIAAHCVVLMEKL